MKIFLLFIAFAIGVSCFSQKPASGTYVFRYCDLEYNACISTCRVVINGDSISIYATKDLAKTITFTKENDLIVKGIILKHKTGKWIIGQSPKDKNAEQIGVEGPPVIDFRKKQFWRF